MLQLRTWCCAVLAALLWNSAAVAATYDEQRAAEVERIRAEFMSTDYETRIQSARELMYSGITDESLFNPIAIRMLKLYVVVRDNGGMHDGQEMAWYAKALASSGNPRYGKILLELSQQPKGAIGAEFRHIGQSAHLIYSFEKWNLVINGSTPPPPDSDWFVTTTANLLNSGDVDLRREGAKRAGAMGKQHPAVFDVVAARLEADFMFQIRDREEADTLAWHCRALGESDNPKYRPLLERVQREAASRTVRGYAADALKKI
ncbi:MAG: hypothetical protein ACREVL_08645 [Solimonas sp.]